MYKDLHQHTYLYLYLSIHSSIKLAIYNHEGLHKYLQLQSDSTEYPLALAPSVSRKLVFHYHHRTQLNAHASFCNQAAL